MIGWNIFGKIKGLREDGDGEIKVITKYNHHKTISISHR